MIVKPFSALVIGGSAGSIDPLRAILRGLPALNPNVKPKFAVICVLHLLNRHKSLLPEIFGDLCEWEVKEAESTEPIAAGTVYLAPPDYHVSVERDRTFALSTEEPVMFSRPSIDLLFKSAAPIYKTELAGLVLSGANNDGTAGLTRILRQGGQAFAQDLATAEFKEMPKAALLASPDVQPVKVQEVVEFLNRRF